MPTQIPQQQQDPLSDLLDRALSYAEGADAPELSVTETGYDPRGGAMAPSVSGLKSLRKKKEPVPEPEGSILDRALRYAEEGIQPFEEYRASDATLGGEMGKASGRAWMGVPSAGLKGVAVGDVKSAGVIEKYVTDPLVGAMGEAFGKREDPRKGLMQSRKVEESGLYKHAKRMDEVIQREFAKDPEMGELFAVDVVEGATSTAMMLPAALAGTPGLALMGAGVSAGSAYDEGKAAGLEGKDLDDYVMISGLMGTTEAIPLSRFLKRIQPLEGAGLETFAKKLVKGTLEQGAEEGGQELVQSLVQDATMKYKQNPELGVWGAIGKAVKNPANWKAGGVGAYVGALFGGAGISVSSVLDSTQQTGEELLSPEGARRYVEANPLRAQELVLKENPTRKDFDAAGLGDARLNAGERKQFVEVARRFTESDTAGTETIPSTQITPSEISDVALDAAEKAGISSTQISPRVPAVGTTPTGKEVIQQPITEPDAGGEVIPPKGEPTNGEVVQGRQEAPQVDDDLESLTLKELRARAKESGLKGMGVKSKAAIVKALRDAAPAETKEDVGVSTYQPSRKKLPRLRDTDFISPRDASEFADVLYTEVSLSKLQSMIDRDTMDDHGIEGGEGGLYTSNDPSLSLGQGTNKGVIVELDPSGLRGKVNRQKPTWQFMYDNNQAEIILRNNRQHEYQKAVKSFTFKEPLKKGRSRLSFAILPRLEKEGWTRRVNADGSETWTRPSNDVTAPAAEVADVEKQAETPEVKSFAHLPKFGTDYVRLMPPKKERSIRRMDAEVLLRSAISLADDVKARTPLPEKRMPFSFAVVDNARGALKNSTLGTKDFYDLAEAVYIAARNYEAHAKTVKLQSAAEVADVEKSPVSEQPTLPPEQQAEEIVGAVNDDVETGMEPITPEQYDEILKQLETIATEAEEAYRTKSKYPATVKVKIPGDGVYTLRTDVSENKDGVPVSVVRMVRDDISRMKSALTKKSYGTGAPKRNLKRSKKIDLEKYRVKDEGGTSSDNTLRTKSSAGEDLKKMFRDAGDQQSLKEIEESDILSRADGKPLSSKEPVTVEVYQGKGRTDKKGVYAEGASGAILGDADYYAISEKVASQFGPNVSKSTVSLKNPLVIDSDATLGEWMTGKKGGAVPYDNATRSKYIEPMRKRILDAKHDGVIIQVPQWTDMNEAGESIGRLREVFGDTQVVVFPKKTSSTTPKSEARAVNPGGRGMAGPVSIEEQGDQGPAVSNIDIIKTMGRLFNLPVRRGRVSVRNAAGIYKVAPEVVRLANEYGGDLGVSSHEVAHHIDKTFDLMGRRGKKFPFSQKAKGELRDIDYDQDKRRAYEGFAEFIRFYLTDDTAQAKAPTFHAEFEQWLDKNTDVKKKLAEIKKLADRWRKQGAEKRIKANVDFEAKGDVVVGEGIASRVARKIGDIANRFYEKGVDEGYALKMFQDEAVRRGLKMEKGDQPYELFSAMSRIGGNHAYRAIFDGVFTVSKGVQKKIGPSLRNVFELVETKDYQDFVAWVYARHAIEAHSKGIQPGISLEDAQALYYKHKGNAKWQEAAEVFTEFNRALIEMLADAGVMSRETADLINESWKTYIPLQRVVDKKKFGGTGGGSLIDVGNPVMRRKGSQLKIVDPFEATIANAVRFYERANVQQVLQSIVKASEQVDGMGAWVEKIPPKMKPVKFTAEEIRKQLEGMEGIDEGLLAEALENVELGEELLQIWRPDYNSKGSEPIGRIYKDGKPVLYQFDPDLYAVLTRMHEQDTGLILNILGELNSYIKLGAVGVSTTFTAGNPSRDLQTFVFQTKEAGAGGVAKFPKMAALYIAHNSKSSFDKGSDPTVALWYEMGGDMATLLGPDRNRIRETLENVKADSTARRVLNLAKSPFDTARAIFGVTEAMPRLVEFQAVLDKHGFTREKLKTGVLPPRAVLVEAVNAANDVTTNFKRRGTVSRSIDKAIAFFNPAIQGTDKFVRTFNDNPKRALVASAAFAATTLAYWAMVHDEDWYQEAPSWLKYGFFTFSDSEGKPIVRVPRSYDAGLYLSGAVEALANIIAGNDPEAAKQFGEIWIDRGLPPVVPTAAKPPMEAYFNYDLFRDREIVPQQLQNRRPEDQTTKYDTKLMQWLGSYLGVSPAKLEHVVNQETGGLYRSIMKPAESVFTGEGLASFDAPFLSAYTLRKDYSASVSQFYDQMEGTEQEYNSAKDKGKLTPDLERKYRRLGEYNELMREIRKTVPDDAERDKVFAYEKYLIGLSRHALGKDALERYPNPLSDRSAPQEIRDVIEGHLSKKLVSATNERPDRDNYKTSREYLEAKSRWEDLRDRSREVLEESGLSRSEMERLLRKRYRSMGYSTDSDSFNSRLERLP